MRVDINYKKNSLRNINTWRLNNTFLNNQQVIEEIKREINKFLETNDYENTTTQNLGDAAKAVLKGKFIAIQFYLKKQAKKKKKETSKSLNKQSILTTRERRTEEKSPKVSRRKKIIKVKS